MILQLFPYFLRNTTDIDMDNNMNNNMDNNIETFFLNLKNFLIYLNIKF